MQIRLDDISDFRVKALIETHRNEMAGRENAVLSHALDVSELQHSRVSFFTAWDDEVLLGCGALKMLGHGHGEIKSMHVAKQGRGRGLGKAVLQHIIDYAHKANLSRLSLETHPGEDYLPARSLYESFGFEYSGPFGDYTAHPYSVFMTKAL